MQEQENAVIIITRAGVFIIAESDDKERTIREYLESLKSALSKLREKL